MKGIKELHSIQISLASPDTIRQWSKGVVKKPETINYRTHRPERDGLFCEKIFGPTKDWECFCGKYKSIRYRGLVCERCGVEVTRANVRRERMGHIELVTPVAHIWYSRGTPNYIALLLDVSTRDFEKVLYFNSYIVIDPGELPLMKKQILSEQEYQNYQERYGDMFRAGTGAEAIKELLRDLDLQKLVDDLKRKIREDTGSKKQNTISRLQVAEVFLNSKNRPEWMIMDVLPVIPPDLRPMVQLDGGRFATSDLNDLYRRVINRNNRLKRLMKLNAPEIIIKNEKRMLQEAVNALIDNGRRGRLVTGAGNRPLKSLNDMLKGKQGRFRQNLLGKRVDYSGRSVIVVGPTLKLHECGLPQKMAIELFKPFIMCKLVSYNFAHNIKSARKMIEREEPPVWRVLEEIVKDYPVMLNRAPTLHRLGIQAFEPVLVRGSAIQLHPLVCEAFNADFDGDQMAVHIPLLIEAQVEARILMLSSYNILSAASGRAVASPSQDMSIGAYYLTHAGFYDKSRILPLTSKKKITDISLENMVKCGPKFVIAAADILDADGELIVRAAQKITEEEFKLLKKAKVQEVSVLDIKIYGSPVEAITAYETGSFHLHDKVIVKLSGKDGAAGEYVDTTYGRLIFNEIVPEELGYKNHQFKRSDLSALIAQCYEVCGTNRTSRLLDDLKNLGFKYSTISGLTISVSNLSEPPRKQAILRTAEERARKIADRYERKEIGLNEKKREEIDLWINATSEVTDDMLQFFKHQHQEGIFNPIYTMSISGARGNNTQMRQLVGMRGLMSNPHGDIMHVPIKASFRDGLTMTDYFISTYGARKGIVDTALRTADSGYLTRRLVDVVQDVIVTTEDCGTTEGLLVKPLRMKRTPNNLTVDDILIPIEDRVLSRRILNDVLDPVSKEVIVKGDTIITSELAAKIGRAATIVSVKALEEGVFTDECVIDMENHRVICGPDQEVTAELIRHLQNSGIEEIRVYPRIEIRSPLSCKVQWGVCRKCYSIDLSAGVEASLGTAVGVIAAQSIGEPGTQLTMRTFHTGGIAETSSKIVVKTKSSGIVSFEELKWEDKVERSRFQIDTGNDAAENDEFEQGIKQIVTGGLLTLVDDRGRKEHINVPRGSVLKVKDGSMVKVGQALVEYSPDNYISGYAGRVRYKNIAETEGLVVSPDGSVQIIDEKDQVLDEYKIPQGSTMVLSDGEEVLAGDILYRMESERTVAIASVDGVAEFRDVKIKNQRVISENGMVFVASTEHEAREYEAPKGVRSSQSKVIGLAGDLGMVLKVKAGDQVKKNDELVVLLAESDGEVRYAGKKSLIVSQFKSHEYYMSGTLKIEQNEDESALRFLAEGSGTVKIISYKSASNKTVDRKRVLIKDEREYVIPEGAQLKFENVIVNSGDDVKSGQKITGPIPFVSEIGGTVSVRDNFVKETVLLDSDLKPESIVDAVLLQDVVEKESGLKLKKGLLLDSETAQKIYAAREALGKLEVSVKSDSKRVIITNDETSVEYVTPSGVELLVADGEEIAEGTKIVNSFAPIVSEIDGKVNYITEYNRRTGEEMVRSILVYSGKDYFLSNTLQLCVKDKQKIEAGEPITDFIPFTRLEQTEKEIRFFCEERTEKKYTITPDMEILIQDGEVKKGDKIARLIADADGTIKLVHPITKSGKSSAVVERFHVQMGEVHAIPDGAELFVKDGQDVKSGDIIARWSSEGRKTTDIVQGLPRVSALFEVRKPKLEAMTASHSGVLRIRGSHIMIDTEKGSEKQLISSSPESLIVADGEFITAGQRLTEGDIDVKTYSETMGIFEAQAYMLNEVQYVYKTQNVGIHDKHIETILRRMVSKVKITSSGDSPFLAGDVVNAFEFKKTNEQLVAQNFKPATAVSVIQGISKASLTTDSFLSAASFQETTKVLTNAAIRSKIDNLTGLKENIIIGNLIPAGTGFDRAISYEFNDTRTVASASEQDLHDGNFAISIEGGDFSLDSEIQEAMGLRGFESSSVGFIDDIADDDFADDEEEADGFTEA